MPVEVDILEDSIFQLSPELLNTLLKDHTTSKADMQRNIFWATSDYEHIGKEYQYNSPILPHLIIGDNGHISRNVPISVISEGMGHDSENTTQIYLASLDTTVVDKANKKILDLL